MERCVVRFLSTPSARRATAAAAPDPDGGAYFYPRPPRGGRPAGFWPDYYSHRISIHALREEGDQITFADLGWYEVFLSTPSARRATLCFGPVGQCFATFLSTPSARRATCSSCTIMEAKQFLSTPSARRATAVALKPLAVVLAFLSTPSARRATGRILCWLRRGLYFYPRPPRGGRRPEPLLDYPVKIFLSTPSARRATASGPRPCPADHISIHALREEGDCRLLPPGSRILHFYPRPPRGGRLCKILVQSCKILISIHALREEGDEHIYSAFLCCVVFLSTPSARRATLLPMALCLSECIFLSTPSARRATSDNEWEVDSIVFLSTPSARRATEYQGAAFPPHIISIHALREEGDLPSATGWMGCLIFLSTPSARRATPRRHTFFVR